MKIPLSKAVVCLIALMALGTGLKAQDDNKAPGDDAKGQFNFGPGTLVLSRSVYQGTASTVTVGETLPPGCVAQTVNVPVLPAFVAANGGSNTTPVTVKCAKATADGTYPGVFANDGPDGSFGVTSPIFLDNITANGKLLHTLDIDSSRIVTSFSSKSELGLQRSLDGKSITFMGYVGGPGFVTGPNQLDVSNSNTPGVIDPTNPVVSQYYRSVAEVDASGHLMITEGNAYSGNNGRAAIKGNSIYYMSGNDNNGGLSTPKKGVLIDQVDGTQTGVNLINATGAELLYPGQTPPVPPNITMIGRFSISQVIDPGTCTPGPCTNYAADKPGKDTNFRGITIHNNTLYVAKGSGGNGINTVYQVGNAGTLPTGNAGTLATVPFTILPGFPTGLASGTDPANGAVTPVAYPFGMWFANDNTLYVCDEGDGNLVSPAVNGNVATTYSQQFSGVQKWHFDGKTWSMLYVLNKGLNIGVPYNPPNNPTTGGYPMPATDGCRNLTGQVEDGIATIYAVTSTVSTAGDQGADPNMLVKVSDKLNAMTLSAGDGDHDSDAKVGMFTTIRQAAFGEVLRGIAFAPGDRDGNDQGDRD